VRCGIELAAHVATVKRFTLTASALLWMLCLSPGLAGEASVYPDDLAAPVD
jgi:hypothetical protein